MKLVQPLRAKSGGASRSLSELCLDRHGLHCNTHRSRQSCLPASAEAPAPVATSVQVPPELADFRPNVGVCVVNSAGLVFAATRVDDPAKSWQMPQGGIDPGEDALRAAERELREETNISSVQLLAEAPTWLPYEFPTEVRSRLSGSLAKYRGQAQRWFLFKFTGDDSEIKLDTDHKEFEEWVWMPPEQLPGKVVQFKRPVYEAVVAEFGPAIAAMSQHSNQQNTQ